MFQSMFPCLSPRRIVHAVAGAAIASAILAPLPAQAQAQAVISEVLSPRIASPAIPPIWRRQTIAVARCTRPPRIDGVLDDSCWSTATHAAGFYPVNGTAPIDPAEQTEVWVCADRTHLYVAFHCLDNRPPRASETERNGNFTNDDWVSLDIDSQNRRHNFSSFWVNARGALADQIEGGTASNITWAGDWKGAVRRVPDGWTAEISIPFALLRYPKGAATFGISFNRQISWNSTTQCWPYLPPDQQNGNEGPYLSDFNALDPEFFPPQPVFLPYVLSSAGSGYSSRQGMDVKYPITTTMTGVASLFPDFETVEQAVQTINFSYTPIMLSDQRPLFAEGANFFPAADTFYSRQIGQVDEGVKVVGKQDDTTLGLLATNRSGTNYQRATVVDVNQDLNLYSRAAVNLAADDQVGLPSNVVGKVEGVYGFKADNTRYYFQDTYIPSWTSGRDTGIKRWLSFQTIPQGGHPNYFLSYQDTPPNWTSNLGFVPELDSRGTTLGLDQNNHFGAGTIESYDVNLQVSSFQHDTGGFFHNDFNPSAFISNRAGLSANAGYDVSEREISPGVVNHDHVGSVGFAWGGKTLFQQGYFAENLGSQGSEPYNFLQIGQGILVTRLVSLNINYNRQWLGPTATDQGIITGTYRLTTERNLGGRIVYQSGSTDVYVSFSQQARSGADYFVIFGDPNSPKTRGLVTFKVVMPF